MQPDVNLANEHGNTALHYASFWNYIGICEVRNKTGHHHGLHFFETEKSFYRGDQPSSVMYLSLTKGH